MELSSLASGGPPEGRRIVSNLEPPMAHEGDHPEMQVLRAKGTYQDLWTVLTASAGGEAEKKWSGPNRQTHNQEWQVSLLS